MTIVTVCTTSVLCAQDPDPVLFEETWYLAALIVDGETIDIPQTNEINSNNLELEFDETGIFVYACNEMAGSLIDFTNASFVIEFSAILGNTCHLQSTFDFMDFYLGFYDPVGAPIRIFSYTLESGTNDTFTLTLENVDGDTAIYGNSSELGLENLPIKPFTLFPNPTTDKVLLQFETGIVAKEITVYDVQGSLIREAIRANSNLIEIDTTTLPSGMYFVQVIEDNGDSSVERFVKD